MKKLLLWSICIFLLAADNGDNSAAATASTIVVADEQNLEHEVNAGCIQSNGTVNSMDKRFNEWYESVCLINCYL